METDMKSLVDDILASRDARAKAIDDIKKDTHHVLSGARGMIKDFAKAGEERAAEIKRIAHDIKTFLTSSAENRKQDFHATMKTVRSSLEGVRKDSNHMRQAAKTVIKDAKTLLANIAKDNEEGAKELRASLKKGETHRKGEFKIMMGEIQEDIKDIRQDVSKVRKDASDMVLRYHHSRMSVQKHWASLSKGGKQKKSEEKTAKDDLAEESR